MKQPFRLLMMLLTILSMTLSGCGATGTAESGTTPATATDGAAKGTEASQEDKLQIITTLFPQYDFVRILAGDRVDVRLILPPGIEPHAFEPTPKDVVAIGQADLFIYTGDAMEPWAGRILEGIGTNGPQVVDASTGITLSREVHAEGEEDHDHDHAAEDADHEDADHEDADHEDADHEDADHADADHDHADGVDPHIWLDPVLAIQMVHTIADALVKADPAGESLYRANETRHVGELEAFDADAKAVFQKVKTRTIVYGGHFAFGYFARHYGLEHVSPYTGFSPDAEPTPKRIAELIDRMKDAGATTIYFEELVDPKVAEVIADATGSEMVLLHGAHNVTTQELDAGVSYLEIMRANLKKLGKGLGADE